MHRLALRKMLKSPDCMALPPFCLQQWIGKFAIAARAGEARALQKQE
jgi:hypothetical protein